MISIQATDWLRRCNLGHFKRLTLRWIANTPGYFPFPPLFKLVSLPLFTWGMRNTPDQKAFKYWSHQSTVCKENPYRDYTDSLTRFLWKESYYSRLGQKWEFMVIEGSQVFFRDWKTRVVLILYKSQAPKSIWGKPKKFQPSDSTTYWSSHLPCIKRFTNGALHAP